VTLKFSFKLSLKSTTSAKTELKAQVKYGQDRAVVGSNKIQQVNVE